MADYIKKIQTEDGPKQIDYNALANLPSIPKIDTTLTAAGQAADAKAVGDAINSLSEENAEFNSHFKQLENNVLSQTLLTADQTNLNYMLAETANGVLSASGHSLRLYRLSDTPDYLVKTVYGYAYRSGTSGSTTIETHLGIYDKRVDDIPEGAVYLVVDCDTDDDAAGLYTYTDKIAENKKEIEALSSRSLEFEQSLQDVNGFVLDTNYSVYTGYSVREDGNTTASDHCDIITYSVSAGDRIFVNAKNHAAFYNNKSIAASHLIGDVFSQKYGFVTVPEGATYLRFTTDHTEGDGIYIIRSEKIVAIPQINLDCNDFFKDTLSGRWNKRDVAAKGRYLYLVNKWTAYKVDISCSDDPVIVASVELTDVKTAYVITTDSGRVQYPGTVSGMFLYGDKLIIAMRMTISSMSSLVTDELTVGSLVMLNLSDLSVVQVLNLANHKMCATPAIYKDVLIVGFVQGGYGAYKITDTGFTELLNQDKTGTDTAAELEFQSCAVDETTDTLVFALYKYGVRGYTITYDGDTSFSLAIQSELRFADVADFNYDGTRSHFVFSACIKDGYVMLPLALIKSLIGSISAENDHRGVLVADLNDLTSYAVYELPADAKPNAPADNGTDPQPTFLDANDGHVMMNLGDKGIADFDWDGSTLRYNGRFGNYANQESEKVKFAGGKIFATYRQTDDTENMWIRSWAIAKQLITN